MSNIVNSKKNKNQEVTRTVVISVYQDNGGTWVCRISEKLNPSTYECGAPRLSGKNLMFYDKTADQVKQQALDFIRGAAEALRGGCS